MKLTTRLFLTVVLVPLAACSPSSKTEGTSTPRPHVVAGIDGESLSEGERRYLDDVLEKDPDTESGAKWRKEVVSADRGALDMIIEGERLTFCKGATRRERDSFTREAGRDAGAFAFIRQEAARKHLC
ncbi:hypothetical protein [Streptomyces sp. NPDC002225]|uniref:hypothetical protein n=1 Tax=Streptomyces sp. NPDC002225 TaxID=3154413 RepID=UPI0033291334